MGFGILTLMWIWSLVFDTAMFQSLAFYFDFEDAKNIYVLISPDLGVWRMLEVPYWGLASGF